MDMMILGWLLALLVGLALSLSGAGGSILAVPILVYFMGVPATDATVDSLFIVSVTAAISALRYYRQGLVDIPVAVAFILPSFISIELVRVWLIPILPHVLYQSHSFILQRDTLILLIFSLVMLWAARGMLKTAPASRILDKQSRPWAALVGQGFILGAMVGLVGAGGGFLIVPVLVSWVGLSMKQAVGTSLMIITINTMFGFIVGMQSGSDIDMKLIGLFTMLTLLGAWLGLRIAPYVQEKILKTVFAYAVVLIALSMLVNSLWKSWL